jgi:hypothetical protein
MQQVGVHEHWTLEPLGRDRSDAGEQRRLHFLARRAPCRWYRLCCDGRIVLSLGVTAEE